MKKVIFFILLLISISSFSQNTWVKWNGQIFLKQGNDSTYWGDDAILSTLPSIVSGAAIKTINGTSLLGAGNIVISSAWGGITGTLSNQSDLQTALNAKLATNGNGSSLTGLTAAQVNLGNVTNESKATMFTNPTFTGNISLPAGSISNTALANSAVANLSGTNTGDNATNTQYSGLAASKQDILVSGTSIKTVGGQSVLGSGNIVTTNSQTFVPLANNFSSTSTTPAAVTGWSFAVTSGVTYRIIVIGAYQTAATTTGGILGISLTTATGTVRGYAMGTIVSTAAASELTIPIVATSGTGSTLTTTGVTAINSPHYIGMDITFTCTGTGTFNIVWASEVSSSAAQLNQASSLIYQALN